MGKGSCHSSIVLIVDNQPCTFSFEILGRIVLDTLKYVDTKNNHARNQLQLWEISMHLRNF